MTIRHFGYLQNGSTYGAAVSGRTAERGAEVNLAKTAKQAIRRRVADAGPAFRAPCPDLLAKMAYTNRRMANLQKLWQANAAAPMKKLDAVRSEILAVQNTLNNTDATRSALTWFFQVTPDAYKRTVEGVGVLYTASVGLETAASRLEAALRRVNALIDDFDSVYYGLQKRINSSMIKGWCNSPTSTAMVEGVCRNYGIDRRRMMKGRSEGKYAAWNEMCHRYMRRDSDGSEWTFRWQDESDPNYIRMPQGYRRGAQITMYEEACYPHSSPCEALQWPEGTTNALQVLNVLDRAGDLLSTLWVTDWKREMKSAVSDAQDEIGKVESQLKQIKSAWSNTFVRESAIAILTAAANALAAGAAFIPVGGWVAAGLISGTAQLAARTTYGKMKDGIEKDISRVKRRKSKASKINRKVNAFVFKWDSDDVWKTANKRQNGYDGAAILLDRALRGVKRFRRAMGQIPKSECAQIYPDRSWEQWKRLGVPENCYTGLISQRTPEWDIPTDEGPGGGTGLPEGPGRLRTPETGGEMGSYGAAEPAGGTVLGMKPLHLALLGVAGYFVYKETRK